MEAVADGTSAPEGAEVTTNGDAEEIGDAPSHHRGRLVYLELAKVVPNQANPRADLGDLAGLTASIKQRGVLQAVLVRPIKGNGHYDLVCGHRRYAACKALKIAYLPAEVRKMTDQEVVEAQVTENADRLDMHPLDEALALKTLVKTHGVAPKDLAAKLGRTPQHVYQRLKLAELAPGAARLFRAGQLTVVTALYVARIPNRDLQEAAAAQIAKGGLDAAQAQDMVRKRYMLHLSLAPFDTASETMFPKEGSCTKCPKRTGNQRELFADATKDGDLCTDPLCFKSKADVAWRGLEAKAAAKDWVVMTKDQARAVLAARDEATGALASTRFVDLDTQCTEDPKGRTWRQLVGKGEVQVHLARDWDVGTVRYLVRRREAAEAAVVNGHDHLRDAAPADAKKEGPAQALRQRAVVALLDAMAGQMVSDKGIRPGLAKVLCQVVITRGQAEPVARALAGRAGATVERGQKAGLWLQAALGSGAVAPLAILVELVLGKGVYDVWAGYDPALIALAKYFNLTMKDLEKQVKADRAAAPPASDPTAPRTPKVPRVTDPKPKAAPAKEKGKKAHGS